MEIKELIEKYQNGEASEYEKGLLETWFNRYYENQPLEVSLEDFLDDLIEVKLDLDSRFKKPEIRLWPRIAVIAASLFIILSIGIYFYKNTAKQPQSKSQLIAKEILPGGNKAILTLADGKKINLSDLRNGEMVQQAGIVITKSADGELIYNAKANSPSVKEYNTIEIPKGGEYRLRLPDGSKIWLNAASTLTYPTSFKTLHERRVMLSGEAYFEVAKNQEVPFRVQTLKQLIEVLGTHFNIKSYKDEDMVKTTLLEGLVKINKKEVVKPGEQAVTTGSGEHAKTIVNKVDTIPAVDWKNDAFIFVKEDSFKSSMDKIGRWYDVEFVCDPDITADIQLAGRLSRKSALSAVLQTIELSQRGKIHFKVQGRRITVTN